MGDLKSLVEMMEEEPPIQEEDVEAMLKGKFTLKDMYKQMEAINKMGPIQKVMEMLPLGSSGVDIPDGALQSTKDALTRFKYIMDSMTDKEMEDPHIIRSSRIRRISRGAGVPTESVRELLKYHKLMQRAMKGYETRKRCKSSCENKG